MSLEELRALMRTFTPGRRVRIKDPAAEARRDRVPDGVRDGVVLKVIPLPSVDVTPGDSMQRHRFGIEIEIETAPGRYDSLIFETNDLELDPLSLDELRKELWRREVNFPRSSGIGIDFPPGAEDNGWICDAYFQAGEDGQEDLKVSLHVGVDPAVHPDGHTHCRIEADFIQCVLLQRKPSP